MEIDKSRNFINNKKTKKLPQEYNTCNSLGYQSPIDIVSARAGTKDIHIKFLGLQFKVIDRGNTLEFSPISRNNIILYENQKWYLEQFHFHNPSENKIEGVVYPLEVHFVSKNAKGDILVIANFITKGEKNIEFDDSFAKKDGEIQTLDLHKIFNLVGTFYSFDGSLTLPPYSEGVKWIVMEKPVLFSQKQIEQFTSCYAKNAREIQPLNNRIIYKN